MELLIIYLILSTLLCIGLIVYLVKQDNKRKGPLKTIDKQIKSMDKENSKFSIEYYPLTGKYFAKYRDNYLQKRHSTGIVEELKPYLFSFADKFKTEEEARELIKLYKEQTLKENVKTINY